RRAGSGKNGKHIIISHSVNLFRGLHPVQDRMGQAAADAGEDNGKHNAPHQRGGNTPAHAGFISGAAPLSQTDPESSDRKSTRLNSSHVSISYAVFCLKKKKMKDV